MKRCPQCLEAYGDEEKFCEIDGKKLLVDPTFHVVEASPVAAPARNHTEQSLMVLVGVLGGVVISAALFVVYSVARNDPAQSPQLTARVPQTIPATRPSLAKLLRTGASRHARLPSTRRSRLMQNPKPKRRKKRRTRRFRLKSIRGRSARAVIKMSQKLRPSLS